tara:strand:- start:21365 stop:21850 length:486 start_codon:yes stop_codon:yes gene_type:complete
MIQTTPLCKPQLDPELIPAALWNREYLKAAADALNSRAIRIGVDHPEGTTWIYETTLLPESAEAAADTFKYCERTVKFLLWAWGGSKVRISNAPDVVEQLQVVYAADGKRAFDYDFMGKTCFDQAFSIENSSHAEIQEVLPAATGGMGFTQGQPPRLRPRR